MIKFMSQIFCKCVILPHIKKIVENECTFNRYITIFKNKNVNRSDIENSNNVILFCAINIEKLSNN